MSVGDLRVKAGEWQLGSTDEPLPFQLVGVKNVEVHPSYDANSGSNDMAVIHLSQRLQFASHIQPICISDKDPSPSETCVTTGWGKQALSSKISIQFYSFRMLTKDLFIFSSRRGCHHARDHHNTSVTK